MVRDADGDVVHAELRRPGGGTVLVGGTGDVVVGPHATEFAAGGPTDAFSVRDTEGSLWTFGIYRGA